MKTFIMLLLSALTFTSCTDRESYIAAAELKQEEVVLTAEADGVTIFAKQKQDEDRVVLKIIPAITNNDNYIRIEMRGSGMAAASDEYEFTALSKNLMEGYYIEQIIYLPKGIRLEAMSILEMTKL